MTSHNSTLPIANVKPFSLLWLPYVLIATVFLVFLGVNFWCYHKRNRIRYLRKRDEKRVKEGLYERRRILALMSGQFQIKVPSGNPNSDAAISRSPSDMDGEIPEVAKGSTTPCQNGSFLRGGVHHSIEDMLIYADEDPNHVSSVDNRMCDTSGFNEITFVSSACSTDDHNIAQSNQQPIQQSVELGRVKHAHE